MIQAGSLLSVRSGRVVASTRAMLAGSLLLAVSVGPLGSEAARLLIESYTVYALLVAVMMRRRELAYRLLPWSLLLQGIDFAVATGLLYLTSGANSPFFSPFVFLVVAATIQWGSQGAVRMGLAAASAFMPSGLAAILGTDPDPGAALQFVVRLGYLLVVAVLLVSFGRHVERVIDELSRLSDPLPDPSDETDPPVRACLEHAVKVFGAKRGALVWMEPGKSAASLLTFNRSDGFVIGPIHLRGDEQPIRIDPDESSLAINAAGASFVRRPGKVVAGPTHPLAPALAAALNFDRALAVRATAEAFEGWALVFDHKEPASEDLAIGALVSAQISVAFERWRAQQVRREAVAGQERIRLARDLHDGVLQFLAGAALQLSAIERARDSAAGQLRLAGLRAALADEQRELRGFIAALNPARADRRELDRPLAAELNDLAGRLGRQWGSEVTSATVPRELGLPAHLLFDVTRFVREGVANAVRHGAATSVGIEAKVEDSRLVVKIRDNGRGFGFVGERDHDELAHSGGPRSLHERAAALGGRLSLASSPAGACVTLSTPMARL